MRRTLVLSLALVSALTLAACGGGDETNGDGATIPPATSPSPTATETSGETRIAMQDNVYQPNELSVASGAELELDNEGENPHTFTIDGEGIDQQVNAGENAKVTVDLDPGTYDFFCRFHGSVGMTGTLTVT